MRNLKLVWTFIETESNKNESTLLDLSVVDISNESVTIVRTYEPQKEIKQKFYINKHIGAFEKLLNRYVNELGFRLKAMKSENAFEQATAMLVNSIKMNYKKELTGVICGLEEI